MKHKVANLEGALLDAAVAKAEGFSFNDPSEDGPIGAWRKADELHCIGNGYGWQPSSAWEHGGPIIERDRISIWKYNDTYGRENDPWQAGIGGVHGWDDGSLCADHESEGPTPLIAAMRVYVASKFGFEVDL